MPFGSLALLDDHKNILPYLYVHDAESTIWVAIRNFACLNGTAKECVVDPFRMGRRPRYHGCAYRKRTIVGCVRDNTNRLPVSPLYSSNHRLSLFPFYLLQLPGPATGRVSTGFPSGCEVAYHRTFEGYWRTGRLRKHGSMKCIRTAGRAVSNNGAIGG